MVGNDSLLRTQSHMRNSCSRNQVFRCSKSSGMTSYRAAGPASTSLSCKNFRSPMSPSRSATNIASRSSSRSRLPAIHRVVHFDPYSGPLLPAADSSAPVPSRIASADPTEWAKQQPKCPHTIPAYGECTGLAEKSVTDWRKGPQQLTLTPHELYGSASIPIAVLRYPRVWEFLSA